EAFATFRAYAGRYTLTGDRVVHHIEVDSDQSGADKDHGRYVKIEGNRVTLRTGSFMVGGIRLAKEELVWERAKSAGTIDKRAGGPGGTWRLVSATDTSANGEVRDAYGHSPLGLLIYTADGWTTGIIANGGRKPFSVPDRVAAPVEERAEAFATFLAYA